MASATEATIVGTVALEQEESSTGVYDLSSYISSSDNLTITATQVTSITFTAVGTVSGKETTATYTTSEYSAQTIPFLIALTSGWTIDGTEQGSGITWDNGSPTSLTLEGEGITKVKVGFVEVSVGKSYPSYVDLSSTETTDPSVLALLQGTVTDNAEVNPTTYELLDLTIKFTSPTEHTGWSNVQVGGMYSGTWLCTATLVEEAGNGDDQTAVITCKDLKVAFETALQSSSISNKTIDYSNFATLQIQVNGTVIKSVSYNYGTPATEEPEPEGSANKTWRFDDQTVFANLYTDLDGDGKLQSDFSTEDGLTITVGGSTVKPQTEGGTVMIGEDKVTGYPMVVTFGNRLQLGTGSTSKANIGIEVEGACTIYVVVASSNADDSRTVEVATSSSVLGTMTAINSSSQATTNCLQSVSYNGETPETIYIYSQSSSINFFYIYVSYDGKAPVFYDAVVVKPASEEIDGYLTVSMNDSQVGDVMETSITVSTDEDVTTISVDELTIMTGVTITDISISFTADADGAYEEGTLKGMLGTTELKLSATGVYKVSADGEVTFTASFTYTNILTFAIDIEFTTVAPVAEPEWTLLAEYDTDTQTNGTEILITWDELGDATELVFVIEYDESATGYGEWAGGAIYTDDSWSNETKWDLTATEVVYTIDELKTFAGADAEGFYFSAWSPATTVKIYINATELGSEETIEDFVLPIVDLFNGNNVGDWGSNTTAVVDASGKALELTFVSAWGSYVFTNWSGWDLSAYDTAILTYSFDSEYETSGNYAQLLIEDNVDYEIASNSDNGIDRGVVTVDLNSNAKLDLTYISQIAVQTASAATITIEEIRFTVKSTTGDIEGGDDTETAISNINTEVTEVARYNLMGQKISGAEKGINIIVYSDGSAKKVLVK